MKYYLRRRYNTLTVADEIGRTIQAAEDYNIEELREFLLQDLTPDFWGYHTEGERGLLYELLGTVDVFPEYVKELAQEVDTVKLPDKLIPTRTYLQEESDAVIDAEYCKWCYRLHRNLDAYQAQIAGEEKELEWQALATEMEYAVKSYEVLYNSQNKGSNMKFDLKLQTRPLTRDALDKDACISMAMLTLTVTENGVKRISLNKTFGFRTEQQEKAKFDWALKLYREVLFDLIGNALIFDQLKWDSRDAIEVEA